MCGIAAIVSSDPSKRLLVHAMNAAQQHRGPDSHDVWFAECLDPALQEIPGAGIGMGHTRLELVGLGPTGDQPMHFGPYHIVYNGEWYNHEAFRGQREKYDGTSDTETLIRWIERRGDVKDVLPRINGMFAFALYDEGTQVLTMATDPFGIKPLHVYHEDGVFACASSAAALLHLKPKWKLDRQGVARFFNLGGSPGVWEGIRRLPGGTLATYNARTGEYHEERWYTPKFNPNAEAEIEDLVLDAIRISAKADVPVGILYSGGIDSSVVALALSSNQTRTLAFHLDSPEVAYAQQGAKHFNLDLHLVQPNPDHVIAALHDYVAKTGEPTMAGHIPWMVCEVAAQHTKALISANGADELFFGYERTHTEGKPARRILQERHIFRDEAQYSAPMGTKAQWPALPALEDKRFSACAHDRWRELLWYVQHDLNPTLDAASMCHGLEVRVPYLDVRVVEAALSIPFSKHGRKDILKRMLLKAGLSSEFLDRPKIGFSYSGRSAAYEQASDRALKHVANTLGIHFGKRLSGRDQVYLRACAMGWTAFEQTHQLQIQR